MKTALFYATGFEEVEALTVVDLLRRAEIPVTTVSITKEKRVTGSHQITVEADALFEEVDFSFYDMLILPGGLPGTIHLGEHSGLLTELKNFNEQNKMLAAVCAAPSILGKNGWAAGKMVTSYPGYEDKMKGAIYCKEPVVKDANLITSRGMGTCISFAGAIIEHFKGEEEAQRILHAIMYY